MAGRAEDDWHMVIVDGAPRVGVPLAPDRVPPDCPDGSPEQQIHLDRWVDHFPAAHDHVVSLGARVLKPAEETDGPDTFQAYADPDTFQAYADPAAIRSACAGSGDGDLAT